MQPTPPAERTEPEATAEEQKPEQKNIKKSTGCGGCISLILGAAFLAVGIWALHRDKEIGWEYCRDDPHSYDPTATCQYKHSSYRAWAITCLVVGGIIVGIFALVVLIAILAGLGYGVALCCCGRKSESASTDRSMAASQPLPEPGYVALQPASPPIEQISVSPVSPAPYAAAAEV